MTENDEYLKAQTKILAEMADLEVKDFTTKKDYITNFKNVTRPLVLSGFYEDKTLYDFCSLIQDMLEKYNISYPRTKLADLFDDDEKRSYNKKDKPNVTSSDNEIVPPLARRSYIRIHCRNFRSSRKENRKKL